MAICIKKMKKENITKLPNLIKELWQEGFFSEHRELSQISSTLNEMGYHFQSPHLTITLKRLIKNGGFLIRVKKLGRWKYIQKYPISSSSGKRTDIFTKYDFHPHIKKVSSKQFEDGHFKEAIQNAFVEVIDQVKIKTSHPKKTKNGKSYDLDGDVLMNHVFGCDNQIPIIKFNSLTTSLERAEQRGLMNLYKGIVGIRDRKAHLNFIQNDPLKTIEYLSLASLLMRLLNEHAPTSKKRK
ncbi:TIGR02391 family protein [Patescibacteria group bacterium]|nr:TIGR02391 family protein [Patescibacteria group bacterium]